MINRMYKSEREKAWRNMMVAAINTALERGDIHLKSFPSDAKADCSFEFENNGIPFIAEISVPPTGDEAFVRVAAHSSKAEWISFAKSDSRSAMMYRANATIEGWFELQYGNYIQAVRDDRLIIKAKITRDMSAVLAAMGITPRGFEDCGKLHF